MDAERLGRELEGLRAELTAYATRLVLRPEVAEEIVQTAAVRALGAKELPEEREHLRPWLFRVVTNLAIDERRRHGAWRETQLLDSRAAAEARPDFVALSESLRGNPQMAAVAKEHLAVCFACTLGQLSPERSAALLLKEVYGFSVAETAELLGARPAQAKAWLQDARAEMTRKYAATCALVAKNGVCHQCVELDSYFGAMRGDPLAATAGSVADRLRLMRSLGTQPVRPWHRALMSIFDELA